jgi:cutinase
VTFDLVRRSTVAAGAVAVMASAVVVIPGLAPLAKADCPDIEVVFARGTGEPGGIGRVGAAFADSLRGKVGGRSVGTYGVVYPADFDFLTAAAGANDASGHIQYMIGACPGTRLVLGGFSQGAAVIDVISAVPFPVLGFNNPLPPDAPDHVAAVAVFGNPSAKAGFPLTVSPVWGARSIDLCNGGDPICQTDGQNMAAHSAYPGGRTNQAAGFAAGLL